MALVGLVVGLGSPFYGGFKVIFIVLRGVRWVAKKPIVGIEPTPFCLQDKRSTN